MKKLHLVVAGIALLTTSLSTQASMFDTDYQAGNYNWAPLRNYNLGSGQQTDAFRDLTWFTHGDPDNYNVDVQAPSFTSPNGVTLKGNGNIVIGSYIKWGMTGGGAMPPMPVVAAIQSGTVTPELLAANPMTPKAIDAARDYTLSSDIVMQDLQTIVFQLRTSTIFPDGSHYTPFELGQMLAPVVLSLNNGSILLNWDYRSLDHVSYDQFSTGYTQEVWSFQWDLSGIDEQITAFEVRWDMFPFGNVTGMQLDQANQFTQVIPEPSTYALLLGSGAALLWSIRRGKGARGRRAVGARDAQ